MLAKAVALWLAVLILLPFSAPFSTCDLASLLPETHTGGSTQPLRHGWPIPSVGDSAATHALPFVRTAGRSKVFTAALRGSRARAAALPPDQHRRIIEMTPAASSVSNTPLRI
jgi:hypothetical protein